MRVETMLRDLRVELEGRLVRVAQRTHDACVELHRTRGLRRELELEAVELALSAIAGRDDPLEGRDSS